MGRGAGGGPAKFAYFKVVTNSLKTTLSKYQKILTQRRPHSKQRDVRQRETSRLPNPTLHT